jgi:hypothetical protein
MIHLDDLKALLEALAKEKVDYVLVGSMGMAAQGLVRASRDIDFFVSAERNNIERLRRALESVFEGDPNISSITYEDLAGDYPAIEYVPPHGQYSIDILARLGEAYRYEDLEWEELETEGLKVRVATPETLYRMKRNSLRPRDRTDAAWIKDRFRIEEE